MNAVAHMIATPPRGRILECTEEQYFADPCEVPSLSQSIAHTLLTESPLHAWAKHPRLGNREEREETKALDEGQLFHKLLLGVGKQLEIIDATDFRTKAAQQQRDEARENGFLPVLRHVHESAVKGVGVVRDRMAAAGVRMDDFDAAQSEVSIEFREGLVTGETVLCRSRLDKLLLLPDRAVIFDVKKIRDAHPRTCGRHMIEYGYDIQHAAYIDAVTALRPDLAGRVDFLFAFLEGGEPFAVTPARPDGMLREHGENRWHRAKHLWHRCLTAGHWPGYAETPISLQAPPWAMTEELKHHEFL
jgi:hypothetical protein